MSDNNDDQSFPTVADFVFGRDVACPDCGYNLRDLPGDRCVECGRELVLGVHPTTPRITAWVWVVVLLAMGVGEAIYNLGWLASVALSSGWGEHMVVDGLLAIWSIGCIPLLAWAWLGRRRFWAWPNHIQNAVAWAVCGVMGAIHLLNTLYYNFFMF